MKKQSFLLPAAAIFSVLLAVSGQSRAANVISDLRIVRSDTLQPVVDEVVALAAGEGGDGVVISQKDKAFAPGSVEVKVGQPIEIHNDDSTVHNAYCHSGDFKYNSGPQQPGTRSRLTFMKPGSYEVRCAIHPKMLLKVNVKE